MNCSSCLGIKQNACLCYLMCMHKICNVLLCYSDTTFSSLLPNTGSYKGKTKFSLEKEFRHDVVLMWEPKWACEMNFTYLISGLALRCQYGWSHRFFHITLTTSWALLSAVLISGETPLYTLIDTRCLSCLRREDCGNHFFGIWSKLLPRISHTQDRNEHWLFLRCSTLKEKQCGQSENKWNRTKVKKTYLR